MEAIPAEMARRSTGGCCGLLDRTRWLLLLPLPPFTAPAVASHVYCWLCTAPQQRSATAASHCNRHPCCRKGSRR